jgi:glycerol-3-phosphate O-acyltransferase
MLESARLAWILTPFFREVSFPEERATELRSLARAGPLVYVMRTAGEFNLAYFSFAYRQRGLPVPEVVHGMGPRLRASVPSVDAAGLADAIASGRSALVFLRLPAFFGPRGGSQARDDPFPALVRLCRERRTRLFLIPQILVFERHPGKLRPGLGSALMGTPEAPNPLRSTGAFLYNFRHAFAQIGAPTDLLRYCDEEAGLGEVVLARKVRGALWHHLAKDARVAVGPLLKTPDRVAAEVLRDRTLQRTLSKLAQSQGTSVEELEKRAQQNLKKIAATYSPTAVEVMKPALDLILNRIYDGVEIDQEGLERIKVAAARSAIILCPSHKSHLDYLILSKVLYDHGLPPPHIAAGENLAFFPLGALFRRGGAFFLRRSFKGDRLYTATFRAYVKRLIRDRFIQEFFIEGGRSRSGKPLSPKLGLLSMEVDAWIEGAAEDVTFIPIAIDYEQIVEGKAFAQELVGGEKKKEDLAALLRSRRILGTRHGRIYLQVDEPVSLRDFFAERGVDPAEHTDSQLRDLLQALAHRIVFGIVRSATVTPAALLGAVLLAHRRRGLPAAEVAARVRFLQKLCERVGARLSTVLYEASSDPTVDGPIRRAAELLSREGLIRQIGVGDETYMAAVDEERLQLSFYKNNLLNPLVPASLLCLALLSFREDAPGVEELRERTLFVSRLFKYEFVYRVGESFAQIFDETLALLRSLGLVEGETALHPVSLMARETLEVLRDLTREFTESYFLAVDVVGALGPDGEVEQKQLLKQAITHGRQAYLAGGLSVPESISRPNLENAFQWLREQGYLVPGEGRKVKAAPDGRAEVLRRDLARFL